MSLAAKRWLKLLKIVSLRLAQAKVAQEILGSVLF